MLPHFNIAFMSGTNNKMSSKQRRKEIDVPIHSTHARQETKTQKIFSANFNARKKHKNVEFVSSPPKPPNEEISLDLNLNHPDPKPNRKQLHREIENLRTENLQLIEQLNNTESLSLKKITKLRDKLNAVNNFSSQIAGENQILKSQYEELMKAYDDLRKQLEEARQCKSCEDLKNALETSGKDYTLLRTTNKELLEDINMLKNVVYR